MDPLLDKARAGQNALEKLANAIPGFSGYRERDLRRDADALQREHLAKRLEGVKGPLNEWSSQAGRSGDLEIINDIETARKRLDAAVARIRFADRGYSGFFDVVKVDDAALARVYEFDLSLLELVEGVYSSSADASAKSPKEKVQAVLSALKALDGRLAERETALRGF